MKIHGFVYLVVGTGIAVISKTVNSKNFVLFLYCGILFAIFGIGKIILESMKKQPRPIAPAPMPLKNMPITNGSHYVTRHHRITRDQRIFVQHCRFCGSILRPYDTFCYRCGQRVYRD